MFLRPPFSRSMSAPEVKAIIVGGSSGMGKGTAITVLKQAEATHPPLWCCAFVLSPDKNYASARAARP
eukprot:3340849-Rhodomonas_salina.1